ncbi:energy-coupling factor transporter transmembrane component T family protein [Microbacterium amylolyticum]|uniref:Biotin transport system permease protein n=1 Tax=Microbacterium amylolyticum TaxID=936337 RepID=A0ABS4ZDP7_9MICO|nr:energy-coupling factor transporter transmembrane protein EcfT [Microbacterium amylolyticum]MBP2435426.1 biotin transport system permease protein [Microbacterium amylolyticum]
MIALFRSGTSIVHRAPAGFKLAALALLALIASLIPHTSLTAGMGLAATLGLFFLAGFGPITWARQIWRMKWILLFLAVTQGIFLGWEPSWINTARIASIVLLAAAVTLTTPTGEMIDVLQRVLRPLRRIGIDPWRVAFTLSLTIAAIPVIGDFAARIREAKTARGVRLGPKAIVTLLVMSLRHADDMADALTARGIA